MTQWECKSKYNAFIHGSEESININAQNRCSAAVSVSQLREAWLPKGARIQNVKSHLLGRQFLGEPPQSKGSLWKLPGSALGKLRP